jgi:hypothetical protein
LNKGKYTAQRQSLLVITILIFRTGEVFERLPYYGEILPNNVIGGSYAPEDENLPEKYFGKINNPSVHIALNQVRKLVNALIDIYGPPEEVVIELARNLKEPPDDISKEQSKNQKENKRIKRRACKAWTKAKLPQPDALQTLGRSSGRSNQTLLSIFWSSNFSNGYILWAI